MDLLTHIVTRENVDEAKVHLNGVVFDANARHERAMAFIRCCHTEQKWAFCATMSNHAAVRQALFDCALGRGWEMAVPILPHSPRLQADVLEMVVYSNFTTTLDPWLPAVVFPNASKALAGAVDRKRVDWVEQLLPLADPFYKDGLPMRIASAMHSEDIARVLFPHYTLTQMDAALDVMKTEGDRPEDMELLQTLVEEKRALEQRARFHDHLGTTSPAKRVSKFKM